MGVFRTDFRITEHLSMIDHWKRAIGSAGLAVALAACGGDRAGERERVAEHIRTTLEGAAPAAMDAPDAEPVAEESAPTVVTLPGGDTLHVGDGVASFYRERDYTPAWTERAKLSDDGVALLSALGSLAADGLDPDRYHEGTAREMSGRAADGSLEEGRAEHQGDLDILLTESFVRAARDLERGLLEPEAVGLEWRIERPQPSDSAVLARLSAGEEPGAVLESLRPAAPYYERLTAGLARLLEVQESGGWPVVPEGETLRKGDRDVRVAVLRGRLLAGEDTLEQRLAATGWTDPELFDEDLVRAVEHFQQRHTLHEDGAFGPNTVAAMNVPVEARIETVRLNLDRWRWLPRELGDEFLLVNVAGFELELVSGDRVLESMNVVVGRTANRTPLFRDTLRYVVVNPYWNVPMSIAREEIIPSVRRDRGYLARNGYEVLYNGSVVRSTEISAEALESGRYNIRQRPGPGNALGNVKFMFPNDLNIYLHDTPAGHLFSQETRAFSYGCIRLERPADLAKVLFDEFDSRGGSDYDRLRREDGERWITLDRPVPIYILYFTAWARQDGALRFHPDIYERDAALEAERLAKLPAAEPTGSTPGALAVD
jgi:L,D-transpeptidase YcbB